MIALSCGIILLAALAVATGLSLHRGMLEAGRRLQRSRVRIDELRLAAALRAQMAAAQALTEGAVQGGTATVRAIHKGIAAIPFTILENIPATRDTTRQVRRIHDAISEGVYSGIAIGNKLLGHAARSAIRPPASSANADSDMPGKPPSDAERK